MCGKLWEFSSACWFLVNLWIPDQLLDCWSNLQFWSNFALWSSFGFFGQSRGRGSAIQGDMQTRQRKTFGAMAPDTTMYRDRGAGVFPKSHCMISSATQTETKIWAKKWSNKWSKTGQLVQQMVHKLVQTQTLAKPWSSIGQALVNTQPKLGPNSAQNLSKTQSKRSPTSAQTWPRAASN